MRKIIPIFILLAALISVASAGTYTMNASRDFVVVPVGSIPTKDYEGRRRKSRTSVLGVCQ